MTADAKVGLLLGLIFIVVIAFLINGLPKFLQTASADQTFNTEIEIPRAPDMVIDNRVVQTARDLQSDIPLRQTTPPDQVVVLDDLTDSQASGCRISPEQIAPVSVQIPDIAVESEHVQPAVSDARYHVVAKGENLPVIAKKFYGPEEGNRRIVIQKLYEANRDVLDSPSKVCVDDKLVIPPYDELMNGAKPKTAATPAQSPQRSLLSKFSDFFEATDSDRSGSTRTHSAKAARIHVVQRGESLWGIAQQTLGDGKRYKEIMDLNKAIKDPDDVRAGMNLKIPQ